MTIDIEGNRTPGCKCAYCVDPVFVFGNPDDPYRLELLPPKDGIVAIRTVSPMLQTIHAGRPDEFIAFASAIVDQAGRAS